MLWFAGSGNVSHVAADAFLAPPDLNPPAKFAIYVNIMANTKKIALITGANKGLGFEMARQLGKAGVTVVLAARDPQKGEAAAANRRSEGRGVRVPKLGVR